MGDHQTFDLYRHYDKHGVLLYVGISFCAMLRLSQHRNSSGWYGDIARVEIERFPTRSEVRRAECLAIKKESPVHNIRHNQEPAEYSSPGKGNDLVPDAAQLLYLERNSLSLSILSKKIWYNPKEAADLIGVGYEQDVIDLFEGGQLCGFTWVHEYTPTQGNHKGELRKKRKYKFSSWQLIEYLEAIHAESANNACRR